MLHGVTKSQTRLSDFTFSWNQLIREKVHVGVDSLVGVSSIVLQGKLYLSDLGTDLSVLYVLFVAG